MLCLPGPTSGLRRQGARGDAAKADIPCGTRDLPLTTCRYSGAVIATLSHFTSAAPTPGGRRGVAATSPRGRVDGGGNGDRRFFVLVALAGIVMRLLPLVGLNGMAGFQGAGEATLTARTLAATGVFGDAYFAGQGPTAHLLPVSPTIAALFFAAFGYAKPLANLGLLGWSLLQTFASYWLVQRLASPLRLSPTTQRWAFALMCLVPVYLPQEVVDFRYWEGALAVCLAMLALHRILRLTEMDEVAPRQLAYGAALTAATFFVSPIAGAALYLCWAWFAVTRLPWRRALFLAASATAALVLVLAPWAIRNTVVLGSPVLIRSNFGLELAIGNHPGADDPSRAPADRYATRLASIHPYHNAEARAQMRAAGGEVAYSRQLGAAAAQWIARHPLRFATLAAGRVRDFFFPPVWEMYFTGTDHMMVPRAVILCVVAMLGLARLAIGLSQRESGFATVALYLIGVALPYALVQPIPRYSYLAYGLLMLLAVDLIVRTTAGKRPVADQA